MWLPDVDFLRLLKDMTDEEIYAKGINDSMIHMDFMVGSDDLHIVGIREDGSEVDIFVDGTWAE